LSLQSILQDVASIARLLNVVVLEVGYYFLIKLYREWVGQLLRAMLDVAGRPRELPTSG
jgi:hypothetical protein